VKQRGHLLVRYEKIKEPDNRIDPIFRCSGIDMECAMTRAITGSISTLAVIVFVFAAGVSFAADISATPASPRLQTLAAEIEKGNPLALEAFWEQVKREQAPLCEEIPDRPSDVLYTFVWRAADAKEGAGVKLNRTWPSPGHPRQEALAHLPNTDVWYLSDVLPRAARFFYGIGVPEKPRSDGVDSGSIDPFNNRTLVAGSLEHPVKYPFVEGPAAPHSPYLERRADVPHGVVTDVEVSSAVLGTKRKVSIYTPPGYESSKAPKAFLIVFDGDAYQSRIPTPTILDNLIAEHRIPPMVAAFVFTPEGVNRNDDLTPNKAFQDFLGGELMPFIRSRYNISSDPRLNAIGGSSRGGLIASYSGLCHPEIFGNVISLSGSYWWAPGEVSGELVGDSGWLVKQFAESTTSRLNVYMDVGTWEGPGQLMPNRMLYSVLKGKGCHVIYREFPGSHAPFNWVQAFPEAIIATLGYKSPAASHKAKPAA
jgi:enterochelin esterase-like enzyme